MLLKTKIPVALAFWYVYLITEVFAKEKCKRQITEDRGQRAEGKRQIIDISFKLSNFKQIPYIPVSNPPDRIKTNVDRTAGFNNQTVIIIHKLRGKNVHRLCKLDADKYGGGIVCFSRVSLKRYRQGK